MTEPEPNDDAQTAAWRRRLRAILDDFHLPPSRFTRGEDPDFTAEDLRIADEARRAVDLDRHPPHTEP